MLPQEVLQLDSWLPAAPLPSCPYHVSLSPGKFSAPLDHLSLPTLLHVEPPQNLSDPWIASLYPESAIAFLRDTQPTSGPDSPFWCPTWGTSPQRLDVLKCGMLFIQPTEAVCLTRSKRDVYYVSLTESEVHDSPVFHTSEITGSIIHMNPHVTIWTHVSP